MNSRLVLDRLPRDIEPFLWSLTDDDPLSDIFSVWFGEYGSD